MQKHYFAYRQWKNGQPTNVQIEVVVNATREEAQRIADEEIAALSDGHAVRVHARLRRSIRSIEQRIERLPNYRFQGRN